MERQSTLYWYLILRRRYHWTMFQAIRDAMWLAH